MLHVLRKLWRDDDGFIISTELILIATILLMGLVVGLTEIASEVNEELGDVAASIGVLDQSFSFNGISGHHGAVNGSSRLDDNDGEIPDGQNCVLTCTFDKPLVSDEGLGTGGPGTGIGVVP